MKPKPVSFIKRAFRGVFGGNEPTTCRVRKECEECHTGYSATCSLCPKVTSQ
jgi:hypothetical protein